jgi:F-type H+-transporting ATPase subunit b
MDQLISTFHIDVKLLIAQAVNFGLVVFVLYKFAYKPLLKHMNDRSAIIEKGLDDAKRAQEELENVKKNQEVKIQETKKQVKELLESAQKQAEKNKENTVADAKQAAEKVVVKAKEQIAFEKEKMLKEVKTEVAELVIMATEKILETKVDEKTDGDLIAKSIDKLNK